jgi:hypothetical protein
MKHIPISKARKILENDPDRPGHMLISYETIRKWSLENE